MNKYIEPDPIEIVYTLGHKHKNVQYVKIQPNDLDYMRYMYSMLWGHIEAYKNYDNDQRHLHLWFFGVEQPHLPKPTKLKHRQYNTWGTFLQGIEHNFLYNNTRDLTTKSLEGLEEAVNMSVQYFTSKWQDFEPNQEAPQIKLVSMLKTKEKFFIK